jgi:hypothetical protein
MKSHALLLILLFTSSTSAQDRLQAGFGSSDITPELAKKPVYLAGYGKNRKATAVHDPIMARAVVLSDGQAKIALVSVDLVGLFLPTVERVRAQLPGFTYVLVSSTHNHEGPDTLGLWGASPFTSGVDDAYLDRVVAGIIAAVNEAERKVQPVTVCIGRAKNPDLLGDSRLPIVKHDELVALHLFDANGKNAGIIVQWNCHPEALGSKNTQVSADFVAATVDHLEKKLACPVLYLTGTVGGLMGPPRIVDEHGKPLDAMERTKEYGVRIGRLAEKALAKSKPITLTPFEVTRKDLFLPLDNPLYVLAWKLGVLKRQAFLWKDSEKADKLPEKLPQNVRLAVRTELAFLKLGELEAAAIPGEVYPELVLGKVQDPVDPGADFPDASIEPALYDQLHGKQRMLIGLANDEIGYILPERQWDEKAPFCYKLKEAQYGEINSLGPETGPLLCAAFQKLARVSPKR